VFTTKQCVVGSVVLLASATGVYWTLRPPWQEHALPQLPSFSRHAAWFSERRQQWQVEECANIDEPDALARVVAGWVRDRPAGGPEIDEGLLVREVTGFLRGLATKDADAYLKSVAERREFRTDILDDQFIGACYNQMTGRIIAPGREKRELLAEFRQGHPEAVQLPAAISTDGYLEVALCKPLSTSTSRRPDDPLYVRTYPAFETYKASGFLDRWQAPTTRGFIRLTVPRVELDAVLGKYDVTPVCILGCVVKSTDGSYGLLDAYLYYSPDEKVWHVEIGSTGFDNHVFWAI
jgi:hypothetical protein